MNILKKTIILLTALIPIAAYASPVGSDSLRYRRSSLCSFLIRHSEDKFADEIQEQFLNIPIDGQFNDHNLSIRVLNVNSKADHAPSIANFIEQNQVASRLVGKWFNRSVLTGVCDLDLIKKRGLYDASALDHEVASRSELGRALLEDAGEDLIGRTYILMNEITYVDRGQQSAGWGAAAGLFAGLMGTAFGLDADLSSSIGNATQAIVSSYKGFSVKIRTHLFRLVWDDETANMFYTRHWADLSDAPSIASRKTAFDTERSKYRVEYVGEIVSKGGKTSFLGINEEHPQLMIRKACQRALEENICDLQTRYEEFRIKAPITSVDPFVTAQIGIKEGVTPQSRFEVLEMEEKNGKRSYKRVGIVRPVNGKIWDNRFMAEEEGAYGATLGETTFKTESGKGFYPGMLLRRIN